MASSRLIQNGFRLFRVRPGTYFHKSYHRLNIDGNGNLVWRSIDAQGMNARVKAIEEHRKGNLVDVTNDPTQVVTFRDEEPVVKIPLEETKPKAKTKQKTRRRKRKATKKRGKSK